ncbi:MAG: hypothetical protein GY732_03565 [Gammaproteobacteria bacterium]|nr:hypothetical protein [Gammaproteobacteria bacterium]
MTEPSVFVQIPDDVGYINLRGDPHDEKFRSTAEQVLGQKLPVRANSISLAAHKVCWLGPNEWAVITSSNGVESLLTKMRGPLSAEHFAVNDLTGGQVTYRISGSGVCELFAKGCTLDFHESKFATGTCSQSGLAKTAVLFVRLAQNTFEVIVRRSFADYLKCWLQQAGRDLDIKFL